MVKVKRYFMLILSALLAVSLVACAGGGTPADGTTAAAAATTAGAAATTAGDAATTAAAAEPANEYEPITLKYFMLSSTPSEEKTKIETAVNDIIQPLFNASVEFTMVDYASWDSVVNTGLAAGEPMDIVFTADWSNYMRNIGMGLYLPLNDPEGEWGDLITQYAPEAKESLGEAFLLGAQYQGVNYGVPTNKELTVPGGYIFNLDLVEKYDFDITTVKGEEDLEPMLAVIKENEPDVTPLLTDGSWQTKMVDISNAPYVRMNNEPMEDGTDDPTIFQSWEDPRVREHIVRLNKWYDLGYVHPDCYLATYSPGDYFNAGRFFVQSQPLKGNGAKASELIAASGNPDLRLVEQQTESSRYLSVHAGGSMLALPITCADPVRAMMLINLMHSHEQLLNTMVWGIKDDHYTEDSPGVVTPTANSWVSKHGGPWTMGNQFLQWVGSNEDPDKYEKLKAFSDTGTPHISLGFRFDPTPVTNEIAAFDNVTGSLARSLLTGMTRVDDPVNGLDALIANQKAAGSDAILAEAQRQFDEWQAGQE